MNSRGEQARNKTLTAFTIAKHVAAIVLSLMAYGTVNSRRWILLCLAELCLIFFIS